MLRRVWIAFGPFSHALDHVNEGGPSSGEEEEGVLL